MPPKKQYINALSTTRPNDPFKIGNSSLGVPKLNIGNAKPSSTNYQNPTALQAGQFLNSPKLTSSNPSATEPAPLKQNSPNVSSNTPKEQYIQSLPQYDAQGGFTSGGKYYGADSIQAKNSRGDVPTTETKTKYTRPPATPPVVESPYQKYLDSFNKDYQRLADIQNQMEAKELSARREYSRTLDTPGGLLAGAQQSARGVERRSNETLADLALRESAAARTAGVSQNTYEQFAKQQGILDERAYNETQPINVGGVLYQKGADGNYKALTGAGAEQFTLGKDQVRYDAQGNVIAGNVGGGNEYGSYVPGADPNVDAWVKGIQAGTYKPSDVPDELQNLVAQALSGSAKPQSEISKQVVSVIDQLLGRDTGGITGFQNPINFLPGTEAQATKNIYNQLKGLLSLDNIKYLKGTGAISDAEQRLLANAASALGRNLSDKDFIAELNKLKLGLAQVQPQETSGGQTGGGGFAEAW